MLFKNNNPYKSMMWMCNLYSFLLLTAFSYYQVETYKIHTTKKWNKNFWVF